MKKFIIILSIFSFQLLIVNFLNAQNNEISIYGASTTSLYTNKLKSVNQQADFGGLLGINHLLMFNNNIGIGYGVEVANNNVKLHASNLHLSYLDKESKQMDYINPENRIYHTDIYKILEINRFIYMNIPIFFYFQEQIKQSKTSFYSNIGIKIGVPVMSFYSTPVLSGRTWGYYYEGSQQPMYDQNDLGFFPDIHFKQGYKKSDIKMGLMLSVEAGLKFQLKNPLNSLSLGLYCDYGVNNIAKSPENELVVFEDNALNVGSIIHSNHSFDGNSSPFYDKLALLSFGVKLKFNIGIKNRETRENGACKRKENKVINNIIYNYAQDSWEDIVHDTIYMIDTIIQNISEESEFHNTFYNNALEKEKRRIENEYSNVEDIFLIFNNDGYSVDQSILNLKMQEFIDKNIAFLKQYDNKTYSIIVEGHTCNLGEKQYNYHLGLERASKVVNYLKKQRIFENAEVRAYSRGQSAPMYPNSNEENRSLNRRVVIIIRSVPDFKSFRK
ncbi:MAG: OmpA family protein [Tannerella sp.]|jgi:outer membrane protein OmpA-like peptidoglycan-associated protein|nr:OmpA family protein [Tannerella sp.]